MSANTLKMRQYHPVVSEFTPSPRFPNTATVKFNPTDAAADRVFNPDAARRETIDSFSPVHIAKNTGMGNPRLCRNVAKLQELMRCPDPMTEAKSPSFSNPKIGASDSPAPCRIGKPRSS